METRISWFGGPHDKGVSAKETLAVYPRNLARRLNPLARYCAVRIRWTKVCDTITMDEAKEFFKDHVVVVAKLGDNITRMRIVDWGPSEEAFIVNGKRLHRGLDVSPGAMMELTGLSPSLYSVDEYYHARKRWDITNKEVLMWFEARTPKDDVDIFLVD